MSYSSKAYKMSKTILNNFDIEAIANACSSANRNSLNYLPILGEGEALLTGVDFPMPLLVKVDKPVVQPESDTPKFKSNLCHSPST